MTVKTGQTWAGLFVTLDATGALSAGTPSGTLYINGTSNGATVTITGSNPYKFSVTLPSLTAGERVDMYITATIDSISTAGIVASEQADTTILSDGVAVASIANNAITAAAIATDAIDADAIKADAITEIQNGLATPTNITAGTISTVTTVTNGVTLADDAITAAKFDESTAFPVKSADTGATQIARVGADSDTLETLSDQIDSAALEATLTAIKGAGWADETLVTIQAAAESVSVPSAADVADAVWDEEISGHSTGTTFGGKNQKVVPSETINDYKADVSGLAVSGEYTPTLSALADAINSIDSGAGGGATAKTYTVTASGSGLPIADVDVWVTADAGGNNIVASQRTNSLGQVTFYLDSGITYYIWRQKDGVNFTNPDVEVA